MAIKYCQYFFLYWYWYGLYFYLEVLIEVLVILFKAIIIQYFLAILFSNFEEYSPHFAHVLIANTLK